MNCRGSDPPLVLLDVMDNHGSKECEDLAWWCCGDEAFGKGDVWLVSCQAFLDCQHEPVKYFEMNQSLWVQTWMKKIIWSVCNLLFLLTICLYITNIFIFLREKKHSNFPYSGFPTQHIKSSAISGKYYFFHYIIHLLRFEQLLPDHVRKSPALDQQISIQMSPFITTGNIHANNNSPCSTLTLCWWSSPLAGKRRVGWCVQEYGWRPHTSPAPPAHACTPHHAHRSAQEKKIATTQWYNKSITSNLNVLKIRPYSLVKW